MRVIYDAQEDETRDRERIGKLGVFHSQNLNEANNHTVAISSMDFETIFSTVLCSVTRIIPNKDMFSLSNKQVYGSQIRTTSNK